MLSAIRRPGALATIASAAALGVAGCSDDATVAEPTPAPAEEQATPAPAEESAATGGTEIVSGTTTFELDSAVERVLEVAGVDVGATGDAAQAAAGGIEIPIESGQVDLDSLSGRVAHEGGISFSAGGRSVEANALALELDSNQVTAEVEGARLPLFDIEYDASQITTAGDTIELPSETVRISDEAVDLLNDQIGVDVFQGGLTLGELAVQAQRQAQG